MAQKFYVVWKGRETGIFTDWATCKKQIERFSGARYKSFPSRAEAEAAFNGGGASPTTGTGAKRSSANKSPKTYTAREVDTFDAHTKIFTDGGCEPNPGNAGSGIAVYRKGDLSELWYGLYNPKGTNNTAELNALHQAMLLAEQELQKGHSTAIFCDSKYSIQCITQWAAGWQKKGWKKTGGEIKNLELIQNMFALYQTIKKDIHILHVNGHVGVEGNELADRMSILAIEEKEHDFSRYPEPFDLNYLLAMRNG